MNNILYVIVPICNLLVDVAGISGFCYLVIKDHPIYGLICLVVSFIFGGMNILPKSK